MTGAIIDPAKLTDGVPAVSGGLRANLQATRAEIEALQTAVVKIAADTVGLDQLHDGISADLPDDLLTTRHEKERAWPNRGLWNGGRPTLVMQPVEAIDMHPFIARDGGAIWFGLAAEQGCS